MNPEFRFVPMSQEAARKISGWHYAPPYSFYDTDHDPEDREELLDPERRKGRYFSAFEQRELAGFFSFDLENGSVELGLGLRPDLTGRGLGLGFVLAGLGFAEERFSPSDFRLSVATFNHRAIRVYEKAGFRAEDTFIQKTNGGEFEFLRMVRSPLQDFPG
jgi:ribosomal-protein-alanine N-acetyltransferase